MELPAKLSVAEEVRSQIDQVSLRLTSVFSGDKEVFNVEMRHLKEKLDQHKSWMDKLFLLTEAQEKSISENLALLIEKITSLQFDTQEKMNQETREIAEALDKLSSKIVEAENRITVIEAEARGKKNHITTIIAVIGAVAGAAAVIDMILGKL